MVKVGSHDVDERRNSFISDAKTHKVSLTPKNLEIVRLITNKAPGDRRRIYIEGGHICRAPHSGCRHETAGSNFAIFAGKAPDRTAKTTAPSPSLLQWPRTLEIANSTIATERGKETRFPPRPNWSRLLPRPLTIPAVMDLVTHADVRTLIGSAERASETDQQKGAVSNISR